MTQPDKLTVEQAEAQLKEVLHTRKWRYMGAVLQQLIDTMRENERLRDLIKVIMTPAKPEPYFFNDQEREIICKIQSNKNSDVFATNPYCNHPSLAYDIRQCPECRKYNDHQAKTPD